MPLTRVVAPAEQPVTLAEACAHLRLAEGEDDAVVTALIAAATAHLDGKDGILGRCLVTQTWRLTLDGRPLGGIRLPLPPVQSVADISYVDQDGTPQTLAADQYTLSGQRVVPAYGVTWPAPRPQADAVTVEYVAGYGTAADVPMPIKHAMLLLIGHWYDQRGAVNIGNIVTAMDFAVDALLAPYRVHGLG